MLIYLCNGQFLFAERTKDPSVDLTLVEEVYSILKMCSLARGPVKSNLMNNHVRFCAL